mgnify:CR=1 FL=1
MSVNKITIQKNGLTDQVLTVPIQFTWDYLGLDQSIDEYETKIITEVIGTGRDFEVTRFVVDYTILEMHVISFIQGYCSSVFCHLCQ